MRILITIHSLFHATKFEVIHLSVLFTDDPIIEFERYPAEARGFRKIQRLREFSVAL